jgi:putative tryptophan/tyrosine transport system substrate-binding protein
MKRREFIAGLGSAAAWPVAAWAQQPAVPVIGYLSSGPAQPNDPNVSAFRTGLAEAGYFEGKNLTIEYRWGDPNLARMRALAAELVNLQVAVLVAIGANASAFAARDATSTMPIVIIVNDNPVHYGLIDSLSRPGGNVTGITSMQNELASKRLNLLHDMVPAAKTVAFLSGTPNFLTYRAQTSAVREAGQALNLDILIVECRDDRESAFETMAERRTGALMVGPFPIRNLYKTVALAARFNIPTMYSGPGFVAGGGLMSYSANFRAINRLAGAQYVARILKGAKPADLPVQQATAFELVINLKAAKALGLTVPETLLAIADRVIE